jgi:hypothetical protein
MHGQGMQVDHSVAALGVYRAEGTPHPSPQYDDPIADRMRQATEVARLHGDENFTISGAVTLEGDAGPQNTEATMTYIPGSTTAYERGSAYTYPSLRVEAGGRHLGSVVFSAARAEAMLPGARPRKLSSAGAQAILSTVDSVVASTLANVATEALPKAA